MGALKDKVAEDIKIAMKAREKEKTSVLRMLLSELKYAQVAGPAHEELTVEAEIKILQTYHKRLEKSLEDYRGTDREATIRCEMAIVAEYLPQKASEAEVQAVLTEILTNSTERNFGVLMKRLMDHFGTKADGKMFSRILKEKIGK